MNPGKVRTKPLSVGLGSAGPRFCHAHAPSHPGIERRPSCRIGAGRDQHAHPMAAGGGGGRLRRLGHRQRGASSDRQVLRLQIGPVETKGRLCFMYHGPRPNRPVKRGCFGRARQREDNSAVITERLGFGAQRYLTKKRELGGREDNPRALLPALGWLGHR
jgi:hypothetical protein